MKKRFELWEEDLDDSPYYFDWDAHRAKIAKAPKAKPVRSHVTPQWSQDDLDRLTAMWNDDIHTVKIALALGKTKNAVIGKAHRMKLRRRDPKDFNVLSGIVAQLLAA